MSIYLNGSGCNNSKKTNNFIYKIPSTTIGTTETYIGTIPNWEALKDKNGNISYCFLIQYNGFRTGDLTLEDCYLQEIVLNSTTTYFSESYMGRSFYKTIKLDLNGNIYLSIGGTEISESTTSSSGKLTIMALQGQSLTLIQNI